MFSILRKGSGKIAQQSLAKVKVSAINQVSLVVKDIQKSVEDYWNIFGIGPWELYAYEAPMVHYYEYHGKPAQGKGKISFHTGWWNST